MVRISGEAAQPPDLQYKLQVFATVVIESGAKITVFDERASTIGD
jgi:hypothetical protein